MTAKELRALVNSFPWDEWNQQLEPDFAEIYRGLVEQTGEAAADAHGVAFEVDDPFLQEHMTAYVGDRITQLSRTTKKDVINTIRRALAAGEDLGITALQEAVLDAVRQKFEDYEAYRALRIARSESAIAYNNGSVFGGVQAGFEEFDVTDGTQDDECAEANGSVWTADHCLEDPLGHPNCLPAGLLVLAPNRQATFTRWFEGELVIVRTADGQLLAGTSNHPVLTSQGWRPLQALRQGDHVFRSLSTERITRALDPDHHEAPTLIEEVTAAPFVTGRGGIRTRRVPTAPKDFHGDGAGSNVHIERSDGFLKRHRFPGLVQPARKSLLWIVDVGLQALTGLRPPGQRVNRVTATASGFEGMGGNRTALGRRHPLVAPPDRLSQRYREAVLAQPLSNHRSAAGAHALRDLVGAQVLRPQGAERRFRGADPRTAGVAQLESGLLKTPRDRLLADADAGCHLAHGLAGLVAPTQVLDVKARDFRGHVFNLETRQGWYVAGEVITKNCTRVFTAHVDDTVEG